MARRSFWMAHVVSGAVLCTAGGLLAVLISGCDEIDQMADNASKRPPAQSLMPPQIETDPEAHEHKAGAPPAASNPATPAPAADSSAAAPSTPAQSTPTQPAQPQPDQSQQTQPQPVAQPAVQQGPPEMETLGANTGVQGQGYGGGLITEPIHQFFGMRNLITWDQIKHDMDIWQAIHNRWPKDANEFQKEILEPAQIELPELPPHRHYVYDPKTGELLVGSEKTK